MDPPRPQRDAAGGEDHGQLRELVARQGRGAEGRATTRRSCSTRDGFVSECTGENIFVARNGVLITPPIAAGALEGITQDSVMTIARDLGYDTRIDHLTRSDLYICDEMFVCGTAAEVSAVNSVDDRSIPCPGRETAGDRRGVREGRPRPDRPSTRTGASMSTSDADRSSDPPGTSRDLRHDAARRRAARGHLADRRRQAAHRRAARLARRRLHRGRLAGLEPEGRRALPAGADRAAPRDEHARRVRHDPAGQGQGRLRRHAAPPGRGRHRRRSASSASAGTTTCSRRSAPRSTRASRWSPTRSST